VVETRPSLLLRLHGHPGRTTTVAVGLAALGVILMCLTAGWSNVLHAVGHVQPAWIAVCVLNQAVAMVAYALAYRVVAQMRDGPRIPARVVFEIVVTGFGAFAVGGGFMVDQKALHASGHTVKDATIRVLGIGALEYAVLAPVTCGSAIALLVAGAPGVRPSLLWPWAIAVPAGFLVAVWATAPQRRRRLTWLRTALDGVALLRELIAHPIRYGLAWVGMTAYWAADIASLYAALRLFGVHFGFAATMVAYSTGYAATRRTLPLGGAGATEVLLSLSLTWAGLPLAHAIPAVVAYRIANFLLPLPAAVRTHRRVLPLMGQSDALRADA
jgi:glycosyltransferase 2 family protein